MTGRFFCLCVRIFIPNLMIWLSTVFRGEHLCLLTGVAGWIFCFPGLLSSGTEGRCATEDGECGRMERAFKICVLRCEAEKWLTDFEASMPQKRGSFGS